MDAAFCVLPTRDLQADISFFTETVGFQLLTINPTSNPKLAEFEGFGLTIRLDSRYRVKDGGCIIIKTRQQKHGSAQRSPGGTLIISEPVIEHRVQTLENHQAEICTLRSSPWVAGRAGTQTRDLIPSRLGGGIMATHIRIPNGGPVADRVHHHTTDFQLVFCVQGSITLVYEDQGEPITLTAGDGVTQPPHIRHRVVETSNGLEVIEINLPGEHVTAIDNNLELPTSRVDSHRVFNGQRFCHFSHLGAKWQRHRLPGFLASDTGVSGASANIAGVNLLKATQVPAAYQTSHTADVLFSYVLAGSVRINRQLLVAGDAFTLPPNEQYKVSDISDDVSILEMSVPGVFKTLL
ncbi:MAG: cupin domain-containing protein [Granulosicoccus sp.]|nr:cupin domain-containing protein [Granulosicoccus sp.]